mmetsp:Transcript_13508/g.28517  ORF Transcript_13508/g.28517 Transcript_13508/m.28517 type:complete len:291 (+) Transcript_13508:346-1218(+)
MELRVVQRQRPRLGDGIEEGEGFVLLHLLRIAVDVLSRASCEKGRLRLFDPKVSGLHDCGSQAVVFVQTFELRVQLVGHLRIVSCHHCFCAHASTCRGWPIDGGGRAAHQLTAGRLATSWCRKVGTVEWRRRLLVHHNIVPPHFRLHHVHLLHRISQSATKEICFLSIVTYVLYVTVSTCRKDLHLPFIKIFFLLFVAFVTIRIQFTIAAHRIRGLYSTPSSIQHLELFFRTRLLDLLFLRLVYHATDCRHVALHGRHRALSTAAAVTTTAASWLRVIFEQVCRDLVLNK